MSENKYIEIGNLVTNYLNLLNDLDKIEQQVEDLLKDLSVVELSHISNMGDMLKTTAWLNIGKINDKFKSTQEKAKEIFNKKLIEAENILNEQNKGVGDE